MLRILKKKLKKVFLGKQGKDSAKSYTDIQQPNYIPLDGENNKVILVSNDFEEQVYTQIDGLYINVKGNNNTIVLEMPISFVNSSIVIDSNNDFIHIKPTQYHIHNTHINSRLHSNHTLFIDEDFYSNGANFYLREKNSKVTIGKDCMFSWGINVFTSDGHAIFDKTTKECMNVPSYHVSIGSHVWLGHGVQILKNASIADNCVVGISSVIAKNYSDENVLLAGQPVKVVKSNINWSRDFITDYLEQETLV